MWATWNGVIVLLGAGYWVYTLFRSLTPVQVCERFCGSKTAAEAKR
jgi:hypothetical protein